MSIRLFNIGGKVKPLAREFKTLPYDAEVEYLTLPATAYINTGVNADWKKDFEVEFKILSLGNQWRFGVIIGDVPRLLQLNYDGSIQTINYWAFVSATPLTDAVGTYCNRFVKGAIKGSSYLVDDVVKATANRNVFDLGVPFYFGIRNTNGSPQYGNTVVSYKSFKMWDEGVLCLDFVPVRKGGVGYMYDRVSGQLFGNAGTGAFVIGPDKV